MDHPAVKETVREKYVVVNVDVEPTRIYEFADAKAVLTGAGLDTEVLAREVGGRIMGAFIRATKPASAKSCCGSDCCGDERAA
jgi:arsenite methyltransferase